MLFVVQAVPFYLFAFLLPFQSFKSILDIALFRHASCKVQMTEAVVSGAESSLQIGGLLLGKHRRAKFECHEGPELCCGQMGQRLILPAEQVLLPAIGMGGMVPQADAKTAISAFAFFPFMLAREKQRQVMLSSPFLRGDLKPAGK